MIQQLLSRYRSFLGYTHIESSNRQQHFDHDLIVNRNYGDYLLRFVVFGWLIFQTYTYHLMANRPAELFAPINWFDKLFMPVFPHWTVWYLVILLAGFVNFRLVSQGDRKIERILLGVLVLWINCIRWKYGFFSHVGHIMVLYHLLGMFVPRKNTFENDEEKSLYAKAIRWLYAGMLVSYTMSGIWKVIGLVYKMVFKPEVVNWLHPLAMKLNSIVGYRDWDLPIDDLVELYDVLWFWQIAFILMLFIQLYSVLGAFKPQLLLYVAIGNIAFHLINVWMIHIEFYVAPIVLFTVFFPYHYLFKKKDKKKFTKVTRKGIYKRIYEDNTEDSYTGFYAFRERKYDKNPVVWGLLYTPFVSLIAKAFFRV